MSTSTYTHVDTAAAAMSAAFEQRTREAQTGIEQTDYYALRDGSPEWMTDVCHEAHGSMFPDDWRYRFISEAVDAIAEGADLDDCGEFADNAVSIWNSERIEWLGSHGERVGYVDEAAEEFGAATDILGAIAQGMYAEASEVFSLVYSALEAVTGD